MSLHSPDLSSPQSRGYWLDTVFAENTSKSYSDVFCCDPLAVAAQFNGALLSPLPAGSRLIMVNGPKITWAADVTTWAGPPIATIEVEASNTLSFANIWTLQSVVTAGVGPHGSAIINAAVTGGGVVTTSPILLSPLPFWRLSIAETNGGNFGGRIVAAGGSW